MLNLAESAEKRSDLYPTANEIRWISTEYETDGDLVDAFIKVTHRQGRSLRRHEPRKNRGRKWQEAFDERKEKFRAVLKSIIHDIADHSSLMKEYPEDREKLMKELANGMAERYVTWYRKAIK